MIVYVFFDVGEAGWCHGAGVILLGVSAGFLQLFDAGDFVVFRYARTSATSPIGELLRYWKVEIAQEVLVHGVAPQIRQG